VIKAGVNHPLPPHNRPRTQTSAYEQEEE